jgi:hypothetical protein
VHVEAVAIHARGGFVVIAVRGVVYVVVLSGAASGAHRVA